MSEKNIYKIRPAGRHVLTIGEELIQDQFAAIVELVKNAYDADSPDVVICFRANKSENLFELRIEDHGHGMSTDDVVNKWLVPSTSNKLVKRVSPKGRIMQGRKGIGRYAASILGNDLLMESIDKSGLRTKLYVVWEDFNKFDFLDQVDILVESDFVSDNSGTILTIHSDLKAMQYWNDDALNKLRFELKKLIPPKTDDTFDSSFEIKLCFDNFFEDVEKNIDETIKPYPILDLFDYRISGVINSEGDSILTYENQRIKNGAKESIKLNFGSTHCGNLSLDIRVYDRDKDSILQLIHRGLKDDVTGQYVTNLQARQLLNNVNGIGVYRNGFRIRPLGDADFDWLKLNEERIQNPSLRIGNNQVAGYVHIQPEEISNLEEKSARDGLKNNLAYDRLKDITKSVISELEVRRFGFRRKMNLSNPGKKVERDLEGLFDYSTLKDNISGSLKKAGLSESVIDEIGDIISKEQSQKNIAIEEIKKAVAIYQGQATLGKIVNIILHEGRRPLNYFKNQIPNLKFYSEEFLTAPEDEIISKISSLTQGVAENANVFVSLFSRLDPLSAKRRETKSEFKLSETLQGIVSVFENEFKEKQITVSIQCSEELKFIGWKQDFYTIFTNLIDNSIFWIDEKMCDKREINMSVSISNEVLEINYTDSGPGINSELLESGVIFEPQFSTKPKGTGLGLSIAGEAASRNGLSLTAIQDDQGAHFQIITEMRG